jgi:aspartyl-tRNA(Asn)/glutamyl-tRNA(Gln) amidotransferase subunit A
MSELHWLTAAEAARQFAARKLSPVELLTALLARIDRLDPKLHAFIRLDADAAMTAARAAEAEIAAGRVRGPLHGVPVGIKDIFDVAGLPTTCHSKILLDNIAAADSVAVAKLRQAGAIILGKLSTHEFAIGGPSFDLPFPPARNPWNPAHVTGGSSSGSGTAIAARMVRMAMGSDTGGSIRGPAAWCGTVGIKPTYGRVSRRGVFPLSWTLDHIGPLSRSVEDSAITLQVLAGHDPGDPASADVPVPDYRADLEKGVAGLRIGIPRAFFATATATTREVVAGLDRTAAQLRDAGAIVEDIELPDYALFSAVGRVIMMAEAFAIHEADVQSRLLDYGEITAGRFVLGAAITAADLIHAQRARRELTDAVNAALTRYDALLMLSALDTAPRFDQPSDALSSASPIQTIPFNVTGHPAMSVPIGLGANGLPIGVQIAGRAFDEAMVFRIGRAVEKLSCWETVALPGG